MRLVDLITSVTRALTRPARPASRPATSRPGSRPGPSRTGPKPSTPSGSGAPDGGSGPTATATPTIPAAAPSREAAPQVAAPGAGGYPPPVLGTIEYDLLTMPAPRLSYAPEDDGDPDPGEIVWGWVPYEDDPTQGKDRPMLVVGHGGPDGHGLIGIQLTSQDRADRGVIRQRDGKVWMDIGTGEWDRKGRPSEVRIDRLLLVDARAVRREGGVLPRDRFDAVVLVLREHHGW